MQCASCRAVYTGTLNACPRCRKPNSMHAPTTEQNQAAPPASPVATDGAGGGKNPAQNATGSTLIEFPGTGRNALPVWRKELSERVREIQQRRAREAAHEAEESARRRPPQEAQPENVEQKNTPVSKEATANSKQLGLVPPPPDVPVTNPIVAAALRRVERARMQTAPRAGSGRSGAATAVAHAAEESYETEVESAAIQEPSASPEYRHADGAESAIVKERSSKSVEAARSSSLVVVPPISPVREEQATSAAVSKTTSTVEETAKTAAHVPAAAAPAAEQRTADTKAGAETETTEIAGTAKPRRIVGVIDDTWLERREAEILPKVVSATESFDDRAPLASRVGAACVDLLAVVFLCAPFAAVIELTIGNWGDLRVSGSMAGVFLVTMFLYLTCSTALAGRTCGMSLFSMHTVDARTALAPTTGQCVRRAFMYMLSLAAFGLGILYALFDAEGRTAHDHLSGTVIVKE